MRKIIHVDMDAFYASVEQRDDPSLRGKAVVVAWRGARSVVCAASYEARKFGVRSAMPAVRAERLCPDAVFVPPDFTRYRTVSRQIREIMLRHTPLVEPLSLDEAYLDVTEPLTALPSATAIAEQIRGEIRETVSLTASAGVAPNKFLAKIASDWNKPDGLFVVKPAQVMAFLAPLPVGRLPGVGEVSEGRLHKLGIHTVGELRQLDLLSLERQFGRFGLRLWECAHGVDETPVRPDRPRQSLSAEDTFSTDLRIDQLEPAIRELAARVWQSHRKSGLAARTVTIKLKTADFRTLTRSLTPPRMPADAAAFTDCALQLLERVQLSEDTLYRLVGVGLAGFSDAVDEAQGTLFSDPVGS